MADEHGLDPHARTDPVPDRTDSVDAVPVGKAAYTEWRDAPPDLRAGALDELMNLLERVGAPYARSRLARRLLLPSHEERAIEAVNEIINEAARRMMPRFRIDFDDRERLEALDGYPVTYFFMIVRNLVADKRREIMRRGPSMDEHFDMQDPTSREQPYEGALGPELISDALARMKARGATKTDRAYARLIIERDFKKISVGVLAKRYGIGVHAVEQKTLRARTRLGEVVTLLHLERRRA